MCIHKHIHNGRRIRQYHTLQQMQYGDEKGKRSEERISIKSSRMPKKCNDRIFHPHDMEEYNKFMGLRNKEFSVKMRLVGTATQFQFQRKLYLLWNHKEK